MRNIDDYRDGNYAICCSSKEEWDKITKLLGYTWAEIHTVYSKGSSDSINMNENRKSYKKWYKENGYEVFEAKEFLESVVINQYEIY